MHFFITIQFQLEVVVLGLTKPHKKFKTLPNGETTFLATPFFWNRK